MPMEHFTIPIVDLSPILGDHKEVTVEAYKQVVKDLASAMTNIGFAYLVNHGIPMEKVNRIYRLSETFFQLPNEIKEKYAKESDPKNFHGYVGAGVERLNENKKNSTEVRESFDVYGKDAYIKDKYPAEVPGFKDSFDDIRPHMANLAKKLLSVFSIHLNLDVDCFLKWHHNLSSPDIETATQMRSLYYSKLTDEVYDDNAIRLGEHSDWGSITLLIQDVVGGLEVKTIDGSWIPATPLKDSIILNSGQLMELWSAGHFHAALHRVRILSQGCNPKRARHSFVYFANPDGDAEVFPLVSQKPGTKTTLDSDPVKALNHYNRLIDQAYAGY